MKNVMDYVTAYHGYCERRACALKRQHMSTQRQPSTGTPEQKFDNGCLRLTGLESDTDIDVSTLCFGAKGGRSGVTLLIVFSAKKADLCAQSGRVAGRWSFFVKPVVAPRGRSRRGAWSLP